MHWLDVNEIFWMTFYTVDRIIESWNSDVLVLYIKYIKQSRIQNTTKTFSLDEFMWKWLWWWHNRFYKAKKVLKELWLIDVIRTMWPDWKFIDNYVRVNYLIDENKIRNSGVTYELIHSPQIAETGNQGEEMLININKNNIQPVESINSIRDDNSNLNRGKTGSGSKSSELDIIKNSDDIRDILSEDDISQYNTQLKILLKMIELWYKVKKTKSEIINQINWLKAKANLYNIKKPDGNIAWQTFYQKIDKWYDWHTEKNKPVKNFKTSIVPFISK